VDERPHPANPGEGRVRSDRRIFKDLRDRGVLVLLFRSTDGINRFRRRRCSSVGDERRVNLVLSHGPPLDSFPFSLARGAGDGAQGGRDLLAGGASGG